MDGVTLSIWIALAIALIAAIVVAIPGVGWVYRKWAESRLRRLSRGRLVLTYDDGPSVKMMPALLDLLRQYDVKATFFLVGWRAAAAPDLCDALAHHGHELASHSDRHRNAWKTLPLAVFRDIRDGYRALSRWISPSAPFRPPFGKLTLLTWLQVWFRGAPLVFWTLDTKDSAPAPPAAHEVVEAFIRDGGGVVLLHCPAKDDGRIRHSLEVTDQLIQAARARQMAIGTVAELLPARRHPQA